MFATFAPRERRSTTFCGRDSPANLALETQREIAYSFRIAIGARRLGQPFQIGSYAVGPWMTSKRILRKRTSVRKGPVCSVCRSEHRVLIEQARIVGCSLDTVSARYGVSRDAVFRHMRAHVSEDMRAEY